MKEPPALFLLSGLMRLHPITQNHAPPALHIKGEAKFPMGAKRG